MVGVHRVVADPQYPLAALIDLVAEPEDFEELLALRAITDPVAADALGAISLVAPQDRYTGRRASIVMAPFLRLGPSRFSPGTYGVLYTADALLVAIRESSYHASRYLNATHMTAPTKVPRYALEFAVDERDHMDIRRGGAHDVHDAQIYDPITYTAAQALGARLRAGGRHGVWYDSVRAHGGTCYATFRPSAVDNVSDTALKLELEWDGSAITGYREITTHRL